MFVTAILPPGNILADLRNVKTTLFRKYGVTSVHAFPPLIPLAVASEAPAEPEWHSVYRQPDRIELGNLEVSESHIVIPTGDISVLDGIASQLQTRSSDESALLPLFALYIGEIEDLPPKEIELIATEAKTNGVGWKRSVLVGLEFIPSMHTEWWNGSELRYLWNRTLKSPRRTTE